MKLVLDRGASARVFIMMRAFLASAARALVRHRSKCQANPVHSVPVIPIVSLRSVIDCIIR